MHTTPTKTSARDQLNLLNQFQETSHPHLLNQSQISFLSPLFHLSGPLANDQISHPQSGKQSNVPNLEVAITTRRKNLPPSAEVTPSPLMSQEIPLQVGRIVP